MTGKRNAHERLPELIAAAVRVFAPEGYRSARMSDVAAGKGLSEAALYRYVDGKEGLFVLAIRHALLLEPAAGTGGFPRAPPPPGRGARLRRRGVPFGSLADALCGQGARTRRPSSRRSSASCSSSRRRPARPPT